MGFSITNRKIEDINNIMGKMYQDYFKLHGYVFESIPENYSLYDYTKDMSQDKKKCYLYAFSIINSMVEFRDMIDGYKLAIHIWGMGDPNEVHIIQDEDIIRFVDDTNSYSALAKGIFKNDDKAIANGRPFTPEEAYFYTDSEFEARKKILSLAGFSLTIDPHSGQISNIHYD